MGDDYTNMSIRVDTKSRLNDLRVGGAAYSDVIEGLLEIGEDEYRERHGLQPRDGAAEDEDGAVEVKEWVAETGTHRVNHACNLTIAALLQQDVDEVSINMVRDAVQHVAGVTSDGTIKKYARLVTLHGPFKRIGEGRWEVDADDVP